MLVVKKLSKMTLDLRLYKAIKRGSFCQKVVKNGFFGR
jgi:hypothetical protein